MQANPAFRPSLSYAAVADILTTLYDPNVQVHLPKETLSTLIEAHTVNLLCQLLSLPTSHFTGTITTGATASNLLGLACGREEVLRRVMARRGFPDWSMAEDGNGAESDDDDGVPAPPPVKVYVATPHASIKKVAGIIGIGRKRVVDVGQKAHRSSSSDLLTEEDVRASMSIVEFDLLDLEVSLRNSWHKKQGAIVVVGLGEVNTGALSAQIPAIRALCDRYEAWLHIDAAFSAFCCLLDGFEWISQHLAMADSICSDGHKQLNVPYDAGLFFIRKTDVGESRVDSLLEDVCGLGKTGAPAYLATGGPEESTQDVPIEMAQRREYAANLPSPLFRNLENSKRFRALPLYATLLSE
jgi:glutamate/tyrosine decarboxylase-like PLP-dependent enzyme